MYKKTRSDVRVEDRGRMEAAAVSLTLLPTQRLKTRGRKMEGGREGAPLERRTRFLPLSFLSLPCDRPELQYCSFTLPLFPSFAQLTPCRTEEEEEEEGDKEPKTEGEDVFSFPQVPVRGHQTPDQGYGALVREQTAVNYLSPARCCVHVYVCVILMLLHL